MAITMEELKRKAKAYDEALENAKDIVNNQNASSVWKDWLRDTFPELKSEDKEIREAILKGLIDCRDAPDLGWSNFGGKSINECIAWLKKQGEQVKINPSEFDLRLNKLLKQFETLPKEELMDSLSFYLNVIQNDGTYKSDEKQGEQKHKFIIGDIISNNNVIYRVDNIVKNCIGQDCYFLVDIESEKRGIRYLIMRDSEGKTSYMGETTWLCDQVDAKFEKQSEKSQYNKNEDERIKKDIICYFEHYVHDIKGADLQRWIGWIKKQGEQKTIPPMWKYKKDNSPLLVDSIILNKYGCVAKSPSGAIVSDVWVLDFNELAKFPKEEPEKQSEHKFCTDDSNK